MFISDADFYPVQTTPQPMQANPNTFNPDFLFFDNPSDPSFFNVPSKLDPIHNTNSSSFIKPPIPIALTTTTFSTPLINQHVLHQPSQPTPPQGLVGYLGSINPVDGPVLSQLPLPVSLDCSGWFTESSLSTEASSASASAPAPASASATLTKGDYAGFDHLSPFDDVCASAFNTPYAPYLDTPDQTPTQTPLFDCVASEDLSSLQLDDLWTSASSAAASLAALPAVPVASIANDASAIQTSTLDFDLSFASPASASLSSTTLSGQVAKDDVQMNARLQAENALLDFVLFDDIAFPSPISTFSTPMTTNLTSPTSANSMEFETNELAMQLVAAAAASMSSQSTLTSTQTSPLTTDTSDVLGSLFSDVDLSPLMETTTTSPVATATSLFGSDFTLDSAADAVKSSFLFDFGSSGFEIQPSPMISAGTTSPPMDLSLFLSLCSQQQQQHQQQQQQQVSLFPSPLLSATPELTTQTAPAENPLKRKVGEVQQADEESPRQFICAICSRAFSRLFNLNTHERTHDRSKARLFACPEQGCTKTFTRRNDCQRHQISIHKVSDIFSCNKCPKRFSSREELRNHTDRNCQEDH